MEDRVELARRLDKLRDDSAFGPGSPNPAFVSDRLMARFGEEDIVHLLMLFWDFDAWDPALDPGDHTTGVFTFEGEEVLFRIAETGENGFSVTFCLAEEALEGHHVPEADV
jgi:hypothetical protein